MQTLYYSYKPEEKTGQPNRGEDAGDQNKDPFVYSLSFDLIGVLCLKPGTFFLCFCLDKETTLDFV